MPPLVSICVPAYNAAPYLRQCLDSALAQTFRNFELVLVDNASTDDTFAIAAEYARRDSRFRLYRNGGNLGPKANFNRCIDLAQGEWVKFLCADDWLEPICLAQMLAARRPEVLLVVCSERLVFCEKMPETERQKHLEYWADHTLLSRRFPGQSFIPAADFASLVAEDPTFNCIGTPNAVLMHRDAFTRFGRMNPNLVHHDDWELYARVAVHTGLCYVAEPLANYRQHYDSLGTYLVHEHRFAIEVISALIIRYEVAYASVYEPVRNAAIAHNPPINLRHQLVDFVRQAGLQAHEFAFDSSRPDSCALADWQKVIELYPGLLATPAGYYLEKSWSRVKNGLRRLTTAARSRFKNIPIVAR